MKRAKPCAIVTKPSLWLLLLAAAYFQANFLLIGMACAFLHEMGHILTMFFCGATIKKITVSLFGISLDTDLSALSLAKKLMIFAAGPVINFAVAACCFAHLSIRFQLYVFFAGAVSLALGLINLMPILPLDGGNVLNLLVERRFGSHTAQTVLSTISKVFFFIVLALAVVLFLTSGNGFLFLFALYLLFCGGV